MALNDTGKAVALNALGSAINFVSLHDGAPGTDGANQIAGITRQAVSWNTATGGNLDNQGTITFEVTSGTSVHSVGLWSAVTGGTFYGFKALPSTETFSNDGTFTINDLDINLNDAV